MRRYRSLLGLTAVILCCPLLVSGPPREGKKESADPPKRPGAWTYEEAVQQLTLSPRDPYLQYVALQLGRRAGKLEEAVRTVENIVGVPPRPDDRSRAELFSMFTGALALQESLQLDAMRGDVAPAVEGDRRRVRATRPGGAPPPPPPPPGAPDPTMADRERRKKETVKVADLKGPTVQSHPWDRMLAGRKPDVGPLARCVPEDFYLAEFQSYSALVAVLDAGEVWGNHLFTQVLGEARTRATADRVKTQLGLAEAKADRLDELGIEGVAVTGSDLYLAEGADLTMLFRSGKAADLRNHLAELLAGAEKASPGAKRTVGRYLGFAYDRVASPDRTLDVYAAEPEQGLFVRSNSLVGLHRVLEAVKGQTADGKPVRRLGESKEFAYLRTLMPRNAPEEDGFIYLSDPFIRRVVGPQLKLTEARRSVCHNHLRMIGHAALLFRSEHGRAPASFEELEKSGCAPGVFGKGELACPDGGTYRLAEDGMSGVCSRHGRADLLTPCCECPVAQVNGLEAEGYREFVHDYSQYWKTYFDPIAVRVRVAPEQYRLETIILPLIDNTIYTSLAQVMGGKEVALDALPVSKTNIFTLSLKVNKDALAGSGDQVTAVEKARRRTMSTNNLRQIAFALQNYHDNNNRLPSDVHSKDGKPLLSWRVLILPYIEQEALYKEFKLDEPWDSPHNKKLLGRIPPLMQVPGRDADLAKQGKTRYLAVSGAGTAFPPGGKAVRLGDVTDGTGSTIFAVEAEEESAVEWTRPADFRPDPKEPRKGLTRPGGEPFLAALADTSVRSVPADEDARALSAAFTIAGNEEASLSRVAEPDDGLWSGLLPVGPGMSLLFADFMEERTVRRFLKDGIGDQVAINIHDSPRLLDPDWGGLFRASGEAVDADIETVAGFVAPLIVSPVSIGIPVKDRKVVDEFLDDLDRALRKRTLAIPGDRLFSELGLGTYRTRLRNGDTVRCLVIGEWGFKFRFFWGRIGDGLYIATRSSLLEEIAAAEAERARRPSRGKTAGPTGHAMIRMRPENWDRVLAGRHLGWAENDREACHRNLTAVSAVHRGWNDRPGKDGEPTAADLDRAARLYGARPFCPEGGRYVVKEDGKECRCSVHGSLLDPQQPFGPTEKSATGQMVRSFAGLTATLTFTDDGLRAVVAIDRKPRRAD